MRFAQDYNRSAAVRYAHEWAYRRNPAYFDYEKLGGDCTNFASQCILAGGGIMNYAHPLGWYYINANRKAPAWTGVPFLNSFLTRTNGSIGPLAKLCELQELQPGDIVQLSFDGYNFRHSPVVVFAARPATTDEVLLAAHSDDADNRPLATYNYKKLRFLHILGTMRP